MSTVKEELWEAIDDFVSDSINAYEMSATRRQERNRRESRELLSGLIDDFFADGDQPPAGFDDREKMIWWMGRNSAIQSLQVAPKPKLSRPEAELIRKLALDLESTGRTSALSEGEEKTEAIARNRQVQSSLCDLLDSLILVEGM